MPNNIAHFAIHADDCLRAKSFYEQVFGWTFEPWGPPNFWRIHTGAGGIHGALQQRNEAVTGSGSTGFECTISVADVQAVKDSIEKHGGTIQHAPFTIEGVGTLIMFKDTEGNVVGAMQYIDSFG